MAARLSSSSYGAARYCALAILCLSWPNVIARAQSTASPVRADDTYEVLIDRESATQGANGSTGTTTDRYSYQERVLGVRQDGIELEFDLPRTATAHERELAWSFPVRVLRSPDGHLHLLNRSELESRRDQWLKAAKLPREACGHWYFTWNAFQVDCDPEAVLKTIEVIDLLSTEVREGTTYRDREARAPTPLRRVTASSFAADAVIDPDVVRRERAERDVVLGEIMRKPTTIEAAVRAHSTDDVSGTIRTTFDVDRAGNVSRRLTATKIAIRQADGKTEDETFTETVERRSLPR